MLIFSRSGTAGQSETSESAMRSQTPVLCVTKYSKGFLCSAGNGIVYMYEKTDERELYKKAREIRIPISADSAQATANMKVCLMGYGVEFDANLNTENL